MDSEPQSGNNGGATAVDVPQGSYPPPAPPTPQLSAPTPATPSPAIKTVAEQQAIQAPLKTWGHNKRLTPKDVKRAILEHMQKLAADSGQQVPADIVSFLEDADVVYLDEQNRPVRFDRVIVTWENA